MVLCPHCDSDMKSIHGTKSFNIPPHIRIVRVYECPLCYGKYRVSEKYRFVEQEIKPLECE